MNAAPPSHGPRQSVSLNQLHFNHDGIVHDPCVPAVLIRDKSPHGRMAPPWCHDRNHSVVKTRPRYAPTIAWCRLDPPSNHDCYITARLPSSREQARNGPMSGESRRDSPLTRLTIATAVSAFVQTSSTLDRYLLYVKLSGIVCQRSLLARSLSSTIARRTDRR